MIKIISGTYGYRDNGQVIPKNSKSEPFSLDKKEEERLVKAGVAVYADGTKTVDSKDNTDKEPIKGKKGKSDKGETETPVDVPAPSFDAKGTVVN